MKRKKTRAELLTAALNDFCATTNGAEKKRKLEFIRQTYGVAAAEKARKLSPSFHYGE